AVPTGGRANSTRPAIPARCVPDLVGSAFLGLGIETSRWRVKRLAEIVRSNSVAAMTAVWFSVLAGGMVAANPWMFVFALLGLLVSLFLVAPYETASAFLLGFIAVRSSVDAFHDVRLGPEWAGQNPASLLGLAGLVMWAVLYLEERLRGARSPLDRSLVAAIVPLGAAHVIGTISG